MKKYTDQEFLYRQTPVNYDGIAKFTSIKGNTLGWNQLERNDGATTSAAGTTYTNNGDGTWSITGTPTGFSQKAVSNTHVNGIIGHKYLFMGCPDTSQTVYAYRPYINGAQQGSRDYGKGIVLTCTTESAIYGLIVVSNAMSSINVKFAPMIIDLTMLGMDDVTDKESFQRYFSLPYYPFDSGSLLDFKGTGIKTTGKNRINIDDVQIGKAWNGASNTARAVVYAPCFPNTQYTLSFGTLNVDDILLVEKITEDATTTKRLASVKASNPFTFTTNAESHVFGFQFNKANISASDLDGLNLQIEFGSSASSYEPYTSTITDLPISTYFPTGMKRAGNVYDELTESKAITRIGAVDMGSLTWTYDVSTPRFYTQDISSIVKKPLSNNDIANVTSVYKTVWLNGLYDQSNDKCIAISTGGVVSVKDTSYSDLNAFRTAMSGVYLYYELATETETDIDTEIFYPFYGGGTEQILPVNGSTPTTSPIVADIEYYTKIDTNVPYRKFWLVNGNGDRWNLTEKELKSFLDSPQGLGFQKSIDVTRYGERAYKNTETYNFPQVSGDIFFYDTANATRYEKYNEFVRFLMVQPLTLYYQIPVSIYSGIADIYTLDCEVINLTKTESKTNRVLTSNVQINGLGFYQGDTVEINGTSATVTINNDGDFPVGFEIEINGDFENPYFTLEQDGELYGEAKFDDDSSNFSSVYVNSKDGEQNVVLKQDGSILPNPLAYQDLSISNGSVYVTFVKLAKGESTLTIGADSYSISNYSIKFTPMYRSV